MIPVTITLTDVLFLLVLGRMEKNIDYCRVLLKHAADVDVPPATAFSSFSRMQRRGLIRSVSLRSGKSGRGRPAKMYVRTARGDREVQRYAKALAKLIRAYQ